MIKGKITLYRNSVFGFSQTAQAQEYRVTMTASVTFKDQVKNRELWSDAEPGQDRQLLRAWTPRAATAKTELDGRKEAIAKIADEIVARSVEGW